MASTDIDGSPVIIFNKLEARYIYNLLLQFGHLNDIESRIINKIEKALNIDDR